MGNLPASTETAGLPWQRPSFVAAGSRTTFSEDGQFQGRTELMSLPATPARIAEAKAWLERHRDAVYRVPLDHLTQWLTTLALQCNSRGVTAADATMRAQAYASTLGERPTYWFTHATLQAAARAFEWFPSVAELEKFLGQQCYERDGSVRLVRAMATAMPGDGNAVRPEAGPRGEMTRLGELLAIYRKRGDKVRAERIEAEIARSEQGQRDAAD